jgi:ABC-2 type transport system permease protein
VGLIAIGVAAVAGQLASTARGANMLASVVIGMFYVLRMLGDLKSSALTWVSPIGWAEKMEPWGSNAWWPLALLAVCGAALVALAIRLEARRDLASGLIPDRPGPADAGGSYSSPLVLALRLQRAPIIGWTATIVLAALLFGSVIQAMTNLVSDSGSAAAIVRGSGTDALVSLLVMLLGLVVAVFALHSTMQLRSDEASGILEPQLAGALSRTRWAIERLLIPVVGSAVLLMTSGALMGIAYGALVGDPSKTAQLTGASIAYWPAVMVLVGVGVALFGWFPRLSTPLTWGLLGLMWILVLVGDSLHLPDWLLGSMPFEATPYLPYESMTWTPLVVMTAIAAALFTVGLAGFSRRDIRTG